MYMAIDQYGTTYHGLKHPRKDLHSKLGGRISKMYRDSKDGPVHVGYVVGSHWCEVFRVIPFKEA